jgi:hypothetical protein
MKFGFSRKFVLCCLLSFICSFMTFASSAVVVSFVGKVEVNRNNAWVTLAKGDKVYQGEMISTGFKSELILKFEWLNSRHCTKNNPRPSPFHF